MTECRNHIFQNVTRMAIVLTVLMLSVCCIREPELHLFDGGEVIVELPTVNLELKAYWDYRNAYGFDYDWEDEWYYGWDETDRAIFGEIGYTQPTSFHMRRYFTGSIPYATHTNVVANTFSGESFSGQFNWGFWDLLVWNDVNNIDGVQSLNFDETTTLEYVTAYTNESMNVSRYEAPYYTRSFYEPEPLFSAYEQAVEIDRELKGFVYDSLKHVYVKRLNMVLEPVTYIYLTQVILHHNRNKIIGIDGSGNLSGLARTVIINNGISGNDAITVHYNTRFKQNCDMKGESVDIIGGRMLTFGICGQNGNQIKTLEEVKDNNRHYLDVTMQFNNGTDSTFVFDVTGQVRRRFKGGVLTVELDMDSIRVPSRSGGSAFDAVVKEIEDGGTHEFEL